MARSWLTIGGLVLAVIVAGCVADDERATVKKDIEPAALAKADPSAPAEDPVPNAPVILASVPDLSFTSLSGNKVSLPKLAGKVVYIDFWAPWCGPCRAGLPFTQRLHDTFKDKGLVVMAVSDDPRKSVEAFVKNNNYSFPTYLDMGPGAQQFNVSGIPHSIIIDKTGHIVAEEEGLVPQAETIHNLAEAGLDMSGFEPKNDPMQAGPSS